MQKITKIQTSKKYLKVNESEKKFVHSLKKKLELNYTTAQAHIIIAFTNWFLKMRIIRKTQKFPWWHFYEYNDWKTKNFSFERSHRYYGGLYGLSCTPKQLCCVFKIVKLEKIRMEILTSTSRKYSH